MEYPLYNQKAENIGKVELPDTIFNLEMNNDLVHQIVTSLQSNKRQVIAHAKGRGEVRGGGKKPWKQKGTGRARHASIRSPIWKGGGATFGPTKERNFKKKINKKMARKALLMALSSKVKDKQVFILDEIRLENPKTKEMALIMKNFSALMDKKPNALLILPLSEDKFKRSTNNLKSLSVIEARNLNPLEVLSHKYLVLVKESVDVLNKLFSK